MNRRSPTGLLTDQVALVTGASSGIGEATARALAAEGAAVAIAARRVDRLDVLARGIADVGARVLVVPTDVTKQSEVRTMVERTLSTFGHLDILVNNAGVMLLAPIRKLAVGDWDRMLDVNVRGLLFCVGEALPHMLERRQGYIVNVGSVAGRRPFFGGTVYAATKFAVRAISAGLRSELAPYENIRVVDIEPGVVDTELGQHVTDPDMREGFARAWGNKKKLEADDIARAIVWVVTQPAHVNVNEMLLRPTEQET